MSFSYNGDDMGVAFNDVVIPVGGALRPCISLYGGGGNADSMVANFGPNFLYKPEGFFGMNPTVTEKQKYLFKEIFSKYQEGGGSGSSDTCEIIRLKGIMALLNDLGATGENDPHLLLLGWKMRPKQFCSIELGEWNVLWANQSVKSFQEMKEAVHEWMEEVNHNERSFENFYSFVFDFLMLDRGSNATALTKEDSLKAWSVLHMDKRWSLYPKWVEYWKNNHLKGVTRDTWKMLLHFIKKIGNNPKNYDENDFWPTSIDDFYNDYLK
eukprot:TRINITY_DN10081_c0_g1_i5.p1 TRINITY_DN10081_c0_g1~~TRINITY_DN10081_c0_g1_i5.p1  ORF type:complete len:268 (+),score=75.44 TRINITY_DN10081_c0_g1_i5:627-1430(+)